MLRTVVIVFLACVLVAATTPVWAQAAAPASTGGAREAAAAYANALALGNLTHAWQLLSAKSQKETNTVQWTEAYEQRAPAPKLQPNTVLRAVCSALQPATASDQVVRAGEAFVEVKNTIPIQQRIVVVKDPGGWRVDLAATDALNARDAADLFLQAMREESVNSTDKNPHTSALLRCLYASRPRNSRPSNPRLRGRTGPRSWCRPTSP